jgi:hypothetical protein
MPTATPAPRHNQCPPRRGRTAGGLPAGWPPEPPGGGFDDGSKPLVIEVTEPEAQRFGACDARQLVDVRLTREGVGGRGERAIRAL